MGKVWGEAWQGTWVWTFFLFGFSIVFCSLAKTSRKHKKNKKKPKSSDPWARSGLSTHKPKNQKNKKPRNQKTKKPKNQKNQKNQDCTPQGEGVRCRVLGLVFLFFLFFWFFGLCVDSHCRCAKQRLPGTVSGCTRSKVDTLQYSNVCYDIVHSANEQQRGMEFNFVRLRHMLLDLCTGNAAICALPWWPVLFLFGFMEDITWYNYSIHGVDRSSIYSFVSQAYIHHTVDELYFMGDNTTPMDPNTFRQGTKNPESYPKHCLRSYLSP